MSLEERVEAEPSIEEKLRLLAEGLDILLTRRSKQYQPLEARHLESVDVLRVFKHWTQVMNHPNAILTEGRRHRIKARLKEGYAVDRLIRAIDGCAASDFHMARGLQHGARKYDDLNLIFRTGAKLEEFESIPLGPEHGGNRKFLG